jgi:adenine-specific DNA-methyltransferase
MSTPPRRPRSDRFEPPPRAPGPPPGPRALPAPGAARPARPPAGDGPRPPRGSPTPRGAALRKPPLAPQVTTLWDYPSQHYGDREQGSQAYRGATPSYVIWNVIYRYTEPGALVVDPFCGSGTTLDVCADLGREGLGFDVAPARPDIAQADARSLPLKQGKADLVFMDPPYADNLAYSDDPRCLGKLKPDGRYQRAMRLVVAEAARVLREGGVLAIYVCDVFQKGRGFFPLGFELFASARELLRPVDVVAVVRHNRTLEMGNYRRAADEGDFFLRGFNYLLLFRKTSRNDAPPPEDEG